MWTHDFYNPPPFRGLNIRIPVAIPISGMGVINYGSTLMVHA